MKIQFTPYLIAIILVGLFFTFLVSNLISEFQALPSPMFGGDSYYQAGCIYHMYETSPLDWFKSSNMLGELPGYLPLYGIIVTIFGKLLSLNPIEAMFTSNLIFPLFAVIILFYFLKNLFDSEPIALLGTLFMIRFSEFPILKYTSFVTILLIPLFFYSLWLFYKEQNKKHALYLGIMYASMGLAHTTSFAYATIFIPALFALILFEKYKENKTSFDFQNEIKSIAPFFVYSFILGFLVSLILWYEPIFIYHGNAELGNNIWTTPDVKDFTIGLGILFSHLARMFFSFSTLLTTVLSISSLVGLYFLVKEPFKNKQNTFILFLFFLTFLMIYSYFITSPLFDFHLVPDYLFDLFMMKIAILPALFLIKDKLIPNKYWKYIFGLLLLLVFLWWHTSYGFWTANQWFEAGKEPIPEMYASLQTYLLENSDANDVILTNNELSFAINGITGRKIVITRRSQNDPFMDFDQRELDAAIMFYGNNVNEKMSLLEKYNVKYVYFDVNWFSLEYYFNSEGQIQSYNDPIMLIYSKEKEQILQNKGIEYFKYYGWIDPAMRADNIRMYDLLLISPNNYDLYGYGPWDVELDSYLTPVWSYDYNGEKIAVLYEFNS